MPARVKKLLSSVLPTPPVVQKVVHGSAGFWLLCDLYMLVQVHNDVQWLMTVLLDAQLSVL